MPFLAALVPAVIAGGSSIIGGLIGKSSADKQAQAQKDTNAQVAGFTEPYRLAGQNALGALANGSGINGPAGSQAAIDQFKASPLYQLTYGSGVDEATRGVERNASAAGLLDSGRTLKAIQDRAMRVAGQTYGNYLSTLDNQATRGQNAAVGAGTDLQNGTNALASSYENGSDSLVAGLTGAGNAIGSGIGNYFQKTGQNALSSYGSASNPIKPQPASYYLP
jgi:hypothetical protein